MTKITWDKDGNRIVNNLTYEDALVRIRELEVTVRTHADSILALQRERDAAARLLRELVEGIQTGEGIRPYPIDCTTLAAAEHFLAAGGGGMSDPVINSPEIEIERLRERIRELEGEVERLLQEREREKKHESRVRGLFERDTQLAKLERDAAMRLVERLRDQHRQCMEYIECTSAVAKLPPDEFCRRSRAGER